MKHGIQYNLGRVTICLTTMVFLSLAASPPAASGDGAVTYKDGTQPRQVHAFFKGNSGHLSMKHWNGAQWQWADQGTPPGTTVDGTAGVITYNDDSNNRRIYAFIRGNDGHLHVNFTKGSNWQWADRGTPPRTTVEGSPGVITYKDDTDTQRIYAFVRGSDGHLYVHYWKGSQWLWAHRGTPTGTTVKGSPGVITYKDRTDPQKIYAFIKGSDDHLYVNFWTGTKWKWADQGTPPGTSVSGRLSVVTYSDPLVFVPKGVLHHRYPRRILAFVRSGYGHLYMHSWDGSYWKWINLGKPPGTTYFGSPSAITYKDGTDPRRIQTFVNGSNDHLYVNSWDGSDWQWVDQGKPPDTVYGIPEVITYKDGTRRGEKAKPRRTYAFVRSFNGHLYVSYWKGAQRQWADHGVPP